MKNILLACSLLLPVVAGYGQQKDTFEVYFPFNNAKLTKEAEEYIDRLIFKDTLLHGDKLIVLGYTDYVGGNAHNDTLSRQRAGSVLKYLYNSGFNKDDIRLCTGRGKIARNMSARDGYAPDRKVQIIIDRTVTPPPVAAVPGPREKIDINKLKPNETVKLNNILFWPDEPFFQTGSAQDLEKIFSFLKENPAVRIRIEGHICCLPSDQGYDKPYRNGFLSVFRAAAVRTYLMNRGIDSARMTIAGLGTKDPMVWPELTEEDQRKNRRVEIRIISK